MINLDEKQVKQLLKLIKHPDDKKIVKRFLRELQVNGSGNGNGTRAEILNKSSAKQVLAIITRLGLEMGKHKAIEAFFHLLD